MSINLTEWSVSAQTAAHILGMPVETLRTWRKRHGLLPQTPTPGSARAPAMSYQLRHLLQVRVAQKLIAIGLSVDTACQAPGYGLFHAFLNGEEVRYGFEGGEIRSSAFDPDGVCITFKIERDGREIVAGLIENIAETSGEQAALEAQMGFDAAVEQIRSTKR